MLESRRRAGAAAARRGWPLGHVPGGRRLLVVLGRAARIRRRFARSTDDSAQLPRRSRAPPERPAERPRERQRGLRRASFFGRYNVLPAACPSPGHVPGHWMDICIYDRHCICFVVLAAAQGSAHPAGWLCQQAAVLVQRRGASGRREISFHEAFARPCERSYAREPDPSGRGHRGQERLPLHAIFDDGRLHRQAPHLRRVPTHLEHGRWPLLVDQICQWWRNGCLEARRPVLLFGRCPWRGVLPPDHGNEEKDRQGCGHRSRPASPKPNGN